MIESRNIALGGIGIIMPNLSKNKFHDATGYNQNKTLNDQVSAKNAEHECIYSNLVKE